MAAPTAEHPASGDPADEGFLTLGDYAGELRRRWRLIAALGLAGLAVALIWSATRETTYEATAKILYRNPGSELSILSDFPGVTSALPAILPAAQAAAVDGLPVAEQAAELLGDGSDPLTLLDAVEAGVAVDSNLILITASSSDPARAAAVANAFATAGNERTQTDAIEVLRKLEGVTVGELEEARRAGARAEIISTRGQLTRLRTLLELVQPAETVVPATPPADAASPKTRRNSVLGLAVGLLLGVLVAVGGRMIDRRLRDRRSAERAAGAPVVGPVIETPRSPVSPGAHAPEPVLLELLAGDERERTVVLVTGPGSEPSAAVASAIAAAARDDGPALALELDAPGAGGAPVLAPGELDEGLRLDLPRDSGSGLDQIAVASTPSVPVPRRGLMALLEEAEDYRWVIVRVPTTGSATALRAAAVADVTVLCLSLGETTAEAAAEASGNLRRAGTDELVCVLTEPAG